MRALLTLALIASAVAAQEAAVLSHDLEVTLDPAGSSFHSVDRVTVRGPGRLRVAAMDGVEVEGGDVAVAEGEHVLTVRFRGKIKNPVRKSGAATWVAGDRTAGTIGPDGTYLVRGYYVPSPAPARFRVTLAVPLPHRAVAPGRRVAESEKDGVYRVTFDGGSPSDGLVVVAGPWVVDEQEIDGISCRTYLYEQDRQHAAILLKSLRAEVPRFQKIFGKVPDGRFDVVENFFATGYGFSNFTLLGDTVIRYVCASAARQRKTVLPAGYLDHELVHCWLGNHVLVDYESGNWCEALTTYFTNYGASEREKRDAAYRRKVSRSFSLRVGPENDYPVRAFREKRHGFENDIGYGKGSMVFDMLARELGRDRFVQAVRHAVRTGGGKALGWDDLVAALSQGAGRDLKGWFGPWLDRKGAPVLEVGRLTSHGMVVTGTIVQAQPGPAYDLRVPVRVTTDLGPEEFVVRAAAKETAFRVEAAAAPRLVELDPDHEVFRRVPRARVAPCLEAVRTAPKRVGFGDAALLKSLEIETVDAALPRDAAVLAVGLPEDHDLHQEILRGARGQDASLKIERGRFEFRGEVYDQPGDGILFSYARPQAPGLPVAFFHGNGEAAFARTRYLPYYASESWVVFRGGRPVARGTFPSDRAARAEITKVRERAPDALLDDLLFLTDTQHAGREAGTMTAYKVANALRGRLVRAGLKFVPFPPVRLETALVEKSELVLSKGEVGEVLPNSFFPFHLTGPPRSFARVVRHPAADVKDALVLLPEDAKLELAHKYADAGAAAVGVVATEDTLKARGNEAAWVNALPPSVAGRLQGSNVRIAVGGMLARATGKALPIPYVYLAEKTALRLAQHGGRGELGYTIRREHPETHNLVGVFGDAKKPGVLLSAHWDGVGLIGARATQGAADNATGVAIVLRVARRLREDHEAGRLKRPVVVALFGGEEWGLRGSRQLAKLLASRKAPIARPAAMINVDGIGSHAKGEVFLIGRSHHPDLFAAFEKAAGKSKLTLGRDIDRFAFREGSDHWPLHEAGVPAVTVFSADYRAMNGPRDTLERVDVGLVQKVAAAVYRTVRELAQE